MLNTNISFSEARKNGYCIDEHIMMNAVIITSPFFREVLTILGKEEGIVEVKTLRGDILSASKVDIHFESTENAKFLRIDMDIPEQKRRKCICTIIETRENITISIH